MRRIGTFSTRRFLATAASQHALLTRPQVLAAGGSDSLIRRRTASGRWERIGRGVFAITGVPWTWRRRLCAILLTLGTQAVVSHRAGAKLLGVGGAGEPPYEFSLLAHAGIPAPVPQFPVQRPDGRMAYIDLAYPDLCIAIETDGRIHLREDVHQADHERRNQLLLAGWTVLHFTYADVTRRPNEVVATIRAAIQRRATPSSRISL